MGANYPDLVQLLVEADQQRNFMGTFGIDRLPQAGRVYLRDGDDTGTEDAETNETRVGSKSVGESGSKSDSKSAEARRRIGNSRMLPELFDELDESELEQNETAEKLLKLDFREVNERDSERAGLVGRVLDEEDTGNDDSSKQPGSAATEDEQDAAAATKKSVKRDSLRQPDLSDEPDLSDAADQSDAADSDDTADTADSPDSGDSADKPDPVEDTTEESEESAKRGGRGGFLSRLRRPFRDLEEPE
jgi:hypothetical protein